VQRLRQAVSELTRKQSNDSSRLNNLETEQGKVFDVTAQHTVQLNLSEQQLEKQREDHSQFQRSAVEREHNLRLHTQQSLATLQNSIHTDIETAVGEERMHTMEQINAMSMELKNAQRNQQHAITRCSQETTGLQKQVRALERQSAESTHGDLAAELAQYGLSMQELSRRHTALEAKLAQCSSQQEASKRMLSLTLDENSREVHELNDELRRAVTEMEGQLKQTCHTTALAAEWISTEGAQLKQQMEHLTTNLSSLNGVYGGMLSAMNRN
jgi:hypothetical protein